MKVMFHDNYLHLRGIPISLEDLINYHLQQNQIQYIPILIKHFIIGEVI